MLSFLRIGIIFSFLFSVVSLSILVLKTFSYGKKPLYAAPKGSNIKGILYAFGLGMMPWEKESARKHLPTYIAGIVYHASVFGALFYLFSLIFSFGLAKGFVFFLRLLFFIGILNGLALLFKRIFLPTIKKISCPDDFAANIIVDIFLVCALIHTYFISAAFLFFLAAIMMFLYIPLGKIRHCFFFFYIRILYGIFYGRRDILPQKTYKV